MFGRRAGLFSALAAVMLLLGGCGNAGANLGGTMDSKGQSVFANTSTAIFLLTIWLFII